MSRKTKKEISELERGCDKFGRFVTNWIVALGSSALEEGIHCVAVLYSDSGRRTLDDGLLHDWWNSIALFLLVPKSSS